MKIKSVTQLNESSYQDFLTHYGKEIENSIEILKKLKEHQDDIDYANVENKLSVYDENVSSEIDRWIDETPTPDEIVQFAIMNQDRWGTEPQMILYAIEDYAVACGIYLQDDEEDEEDEEDEFYEGSFQFDKSEDSQNESVEIIDNFTAQYYDNYDDEEEETDYEVDFQNNSQENLKKIQMFEDFVDKVTYEMSGHPPKNLWEFKADFEYDMQKWGYLHTRLNKKTDMLIATSDDLNTLKCQKAKKDGIPIYTYEEAFKKKEKLYTRVIRSKKIANLKPEKD